MNTRTTLAVLAAILTVGGANAQPDPVKTREDLMNQNNKHAKVVVQMVKGQTPFDAGAVAAAFDQWADTAKQLPNLFPPGSEHGGDNRAAPEIWLNKQDFDAKAAAFGKAVADNRAKAVASLDGLKVAVSEIGKECDNCHKRYRLSRR